MSWRDRLQPASFRGAQFFVESNSKTPSRRQVIHEFPLREDVELDDMGRGPDRFQVKGYVIGPDYDIARDALEDALMTPGAGSLVLPTRGRMQVALEGDPQIEESPASRGGMATFTFSVVLVLPGSTAPKTPATGQALARTANAVSDAAGGRFVSTFSTTGMPSGFIQSAIDRTTEAAAALTTAREAISGALGIADSVTRALETFASDVDAMVADPYLLLGRFGPLAEDILSAGVRATDAAESAALAIRDAGRITVNRRTTRQTLAASLVMQDVGADDTEIAEVTPMSEREASNRTELTNMIRAVSLAAIARAAVSMPFTSHQEAIAAASALASQIETASETLDDETYIAMRNMGVALSAHLARVASTLPEIRTHVVTGDTSVTMLAHWLYGDATRADEIVARNRIKNPGLIPVGTRLEVTAA